VDADPSLRVGSEGQSVIHERHPGAVKGELLPRNPVLATQVPRPGDPALAVLLPEHVEAVLAAAKGTPWEVPLTLAAWTGARRSEVLALRWRDLDLDAGTATIGRTLQVRPRDSGGGVGFGDPKTAKSRRTIRLAPHPGGRPTGSQGRSGRPTPRPGALDGSMGT